MLENLLKDVRYGIRVFIKSPVITGIILFTLALGIGANTIIFSVVNAVLLRPLPYNDSDRLVMVWGNNLKQGRDRTNVSLSDYFDWQSRNDVFDDIVSTGPNLFNVTDQSEPFQVRGAIVSASFFSLLGVPALRGRTFLPSEEKEYLVVVGRDFWKNHLGSDPAVVGKPIALDDKPYTIVGVMPQEFQLPSSDIELWTTLAPVYDTGRAQLQNRAFRAYRVIARLKQGVTLQQAQAEMDSVASNLEQAYPATNAGIGVRLAPLRDHIVGNVRIALLILLGAVGFVLLIVCVNIANLLLSQTASREKELAIRAALGADRARLVRQLLTESILLALIGGVIGLLLTFWGSDAVAKLNPGNIPRLDEMRVDGWLLSFTILISLIVGIGFGTMPAFLASQLNLEGVLKEGGRGSSSGVRGRYTRNILIVAEVAMALVLLVGSGLLIKSFIRLVKTDLGFDPNNVLTMRVILPQSRYPNPQQAADFFQQVVDRVQTVPGVEYVTVSSSLPPNLSQVRLPFTIDGQASQDPRNKPLAQFFGITPNYFQTMGVSMLEGRDFSNQETAQSPPVVIINKSIARRFFADQNPIGKRLKLGNADSNNPWMTVVGLVEDVKYSGIDSDAESGFYVPFIQNVSLGAYLITRTTSDPQLLAESVRAAVMDVSRNGSISDVRTMDQILYTELARPRFNMVLLTSFAAIALVLAVVGVYGVISYSVSQRTREIGIRMALGAQRSDIFRLVLIFVLKLTVLGVVIGLGGAYAMTRLMSSLLFGVSTTDPLIFMSVAVILMAVMVAASYFPIRRAVEINPIAALRSE
ncbi:MAG: ABC transporter permease [Blastocatellia bacterium]